MIPAMAEAVGLILLGAIVFVGGWLARHVSEEVPFEPPRKPR